MEEIWVESPIPGYQASSLGRIRNIRTLRPRKLTPDKDGYFRFSVYFPESGKYGSARVHRIICEAFHGPPPEAKSMALHKNGDPRDNRPENLYWGDALDNASDMFEHGTARMSAWTACSRGHEYAEGSYYLTRAGKRACKECYRSRRIPPPAGDRRHGKKSTYDNLGCRCDGCSSAKREWTRAYNKRRRSGGA